MTGDDARVDWWQVAFNDMQIGATDTACDHFQQDVSRLRFGLGDVLN